MRSGNVCDWSGVLVYLECRGGEIHRASRELLAEAWRLAGKLGAEVFALGIGSDMGQIAEQLKDYPVKRAYLYETEDEYLPLLYERTAVSCIRELMPEIVLIGGTPEGRALAPRLAVSFETGLTADCTSLEIDGMGRLVQTRPAFGGNVMADILTPDARPQFATVRPGVLAEEVGICSADTEYIRRDVPASDHGVRICRTVPVRAENDIMEKDILIVAGRGIRQKEDLGMLRELATLLGGGFASSRALVEKGWTSPGEQIGLSGHTVSPRYMLTCGVSGTVQFMAGMKNTKNIIAINTDPNARIFEIAHYPVCGDLYEIVPELINKIRIRRKNGHFDEGIFSGSNGSMSGHSGDQE